MTYVPFQQELDDATLEVNQARSELMDAENDLEWLEREVRVKYVSSEFSAAKNDAQRKLIVEQRLYVAADAENWQWKNLKDQAFAASKRLHKAQLQRQDVLEKMRAASGLRAAGVG